MHEFLCNVFDFGSGSTDGNKNRNPHSVYVTVNSSRFTHALLKISWLLIIYCISRLIMKKKKNVYAPEQIPITKHKINNSYITILVVYKCAHRGKNEGRVEY